MATNNTRGINPEVLKQIASGLLVGMDGLLQDTDPFSFGGQVNRNPAVEVIDSYQPTQVRYSGSEFGVAA
jgi:hypothetical protein